MVPGERMAADRVGRAFTQVTEVRQPDNGRTIPNNPWTIRPSRLTALAPPWSYDRTDSRGDVKRNAEAVTVRRPPFGISRLSLPVFGRDTERMMVWPKPGSAEGRRPGWGHESQGQRPFTTKGAKGMSPDSGQLTDTTHQNRCNVIDTSETMPVRTDRAGRTPPGPVRSGHGQPGRPVRRTSAPVRPGPTPGRAGPVTASWTPVRRSAPECWPGGRGPGRAGRCPRPRAPA